MKKILSLFSGLILVTPLSVNLYSCNSSEEEDPKVFQQKIDELVDLFNYYNKHNDDSHGGISFELHSNQKELFAKYETLKSNQVDKLTLSQILLNYIFFSARNRIETYLFNENEQHDEKKINKELAKFNFLKLNLQDSEDSEDFPHEVGKAYYWEQVWNNPQIKVIADNENILDRIIDEEKGHNPNFETINLRLQYIQTNKNVITSTKYFEAQIENYYE